jgi:hypothetical protein
VVCPKVRSDPAKQPDLWQAIRRHAACFSQDAEIRRVLITEYCNGGKLKTLLDGRCQWPSSTDRVLHVPDTVSLVTFSDIIGFEIYSFDTIPRVLASDERAISHRTF